LAGFTIIPVCIDAKIIGYPPVPMVYWVTYVAVATYIESAKTVPYILSTPLLGFAPY